MLPLTTLKGIRSTPDHLPRIPDYVQTAVLAGGGAAVAISLPAETSAVIFTATDHFYLGQSGETAVVPTVTITDGTGSMLDPEAMRIEGETSLSLIASADTIVSIACYS